MTQDIGETTDVAKQNPEIVEQLTKLAREFDLRLQGDKRPLEFADGAKPPARGQVRTIEDDLSAWLNR